MTPKGTLNPNNIPTKPPILLKTKLMPQDVMGVIEKKKTSLFGSALRHPKPEEVKVENPVEITH